MKAIEGTLFTLMLAVLAAALICASLLLSGPARLVPLTVLVVTLILLGLQLLLDLAPRLAKVWGRLFPMDLFGIQRFMRATARQAGGAKRSPERERASLAWVLGFVALVLLLGLAPAVPVFAFAYLRWGAGERSLLSFAMSAGLWAVLHGVFVALLGLHLYGGVVW
ncbi:MAG: tripartite tricarboxylate transporter TctB family protein [Candidatus Brocadiia bacterium]